MSDSGRMGTSALETRGQTPCSCDHVEWSCQCSVKSVSVWLVLNDTVLCLPHHRFTLWTSSGLCTGTLVSGKTSFPSSQTECGRLCWASPLQCGRWVLTSMVFTSSHLETVYYLRAQRQLIIVVAGVATWHQMEIWLPFSITLYCD